MTTTIDNLPEGTTTTDFWFDSSVANGSFPESRDYANFSFGDKPITNCVGYQFLGCSVSNSYYIFDGTNNQIQFTIGSKVYVTSITPGTYNASNLVTQLNLDFTSNTLAVSGQSSAADNGTLVDDLVLTPSFMAVLVDGTTSQLLIYPSSGAGAAFSIQFPTSYTIGAGGTNAGVTFPFYSAQEILGFQGASASKSFASTLAVTPDNSNVAINSGVAVNRIYSPYLVQLAGPDYLILHSDLVGYADKKSLQYPNQVQSDQFAHVPVNVNYQGTIYVTADDKVSLVNSQSPISSCFIYFSLGNRTTHTSYDIDGNSTLQKYVSFNGAPFVVGVRFFQSGRTINSTQMDEGSGDKISHAQPVRDGLVHKIHENTVNRNQVLFRKNKKQKR